RTAVGRNQEGTTKTIYVQQAGERPVARPIASGTTLRQVLLACGVLSSLLYVAMNVFIPMRWDAYSLTSQTVSELSAIGAPTRSLWVPKGWGIWAGRRDAPRLPI